MSEAEHKLLNIGESIQELNWYQLEFLRSTAKTLLSSISTEPFQSESELLVQEILCRRNSLYTLSFSQVLKLVNRCNDIELYAVQLICADLLNTLGNPQRNSYVLSVKVLFPNLKLHNDRNSMSAEKRINKLCLQSSWVEYEKPDEALKLLDQALELAKNNGLHYGHIEALRLNLTNGDRSNLIGYYKKEIEDHFQNNDLWKAYIALCDLANEYGFQGYNQEKKVYLNKAEKTLNSLISSNSPITKYPELEDYRRLMLKKHLVRLNQDIQNLEKM